LLGSVPISVAIVPEQLLIGHNCHPVLSYGERELRRKHVISSVEASRTFSIREATASDC